MLHMEYGPVSARPSRPCVQQVLSGWGKGGVRCSSGREAGKGVVGWEGEGGEPGSGGGHGWGVGRKTSLNKMNIWESCRWSAFRFIRPRRVDVRPHMDTPQGKGHEP